MKNNFKIAIRFIKSNKIQTALIALGIALGVTVQLFLGLLINNLNDNLLDKTIGSSSQITISPTKKDNLISDYDGLINDIEVKDGDKITTIMKVLDNPALVKEADSTKSILIRGMDYSKDKDIYDISNKIIDGKFPTENNEVLLAKGISDELNLKVGDTLKFSTPNIGEKSVRVSGIADFKVKALNDLWVVTNINFAQKLFNSDGKISAIEMKIAKEYIFDVDDIGQNISASIPSGLKVTNWKDDNESLLDAISGQKSSSLTIQVFIIISVTMSIAGVLAISVLQKSKQIGILKAMGITDRAAASIFILEGLIFGVIGALSGTVLGIGLFKIFTLVVKTADGNPLVPGNMYYGFIALSIGISILASIIASAVAARNSLKLDPMDTIRNN